MSSAVQDAIALALNEQANKETDHTEKVTDSEAPEPRKQIDIRRSFNALRVGLPLISAALNSSDAPDEALEQMMRLTKELSSELIGDFSDMTDQDDKSQKAAIVRTAILKCVEVAAVNDKLDDIDPNTLVSLINQTLEIDAGQQEKPFKGKNFNVHFLLSAGIAAQSYVPNDSELKSHTKSLLEITHTSFSEMLKHDIDINQLQIIQQSFLPDVSNFYRRVAEDEARRQRTEALGGSKNDVALTQLIEKRYQVYLSGVVNAALTNSEGI